MNTNLAIAQNVAANNTGFPSSWILIGVCTVLLIGGLVVYYFTQKESNPWYAKRISWMEYWFGPSAAEISNAVKPSETWCFVGEDNTGRWCVQVPLPSLCEPIRSYESRSRCEMTLAQQLPSGISKNGGTSSRPMASLSVHR